MPGSGRPPFQFAYVTPSAPLQGLVAFHYIFRVGDQPFDQILCALLGQVQIGVDGEGTCDLKGGAQTAPRLSLIGPTDRAVRMVAPPGFVGVGGALTPAGWSPLRARPNLANRVVALADGLAATDEARLDDPTDGEAGAAALDAYLSARLAASAVDPRIAVIDAWIIGGESGDVEALAAALSMSRRSLERLTLRTHGATPKRISAKYRALKVAGRMAIGDLTTWRDALAAERFADQPHFIRDFRQFVGLTPTAFMADSDGFARRLLRGQWRAGQLMGISICH